MQPGVTPNLLLCLLAMLLPRHSFLARFSITWTAVFVAALCGHLILSFGYEVHKARASIEQYIGIWEEDIAGADLFHKDHTLRDKVLRQLRDVNEAVGPTEVSDAPTLSCRFGDDVPITYNSLPAGQVRVCFHGSKLLVQSLTSPMFTAGLLLGLIFLGFGFRREFLARFHQQQLQADLDRSEEVARISRQVAHDIRTPLGVLKTLHNVSSDLGPERSELLGVAVRRIHEIAEDLLKRSQKPRVDATQPKASQASSDFSNLVEGLLMQYRFTHPQISFEWKTMPSSAPGLPIERIKLERMISNILNNAIESLPPTGGAVHVELASKGTRQILQVIDNGCGIPDEVLPRLGREGQSFGKAGGSGLGLFDTERTLRAIQGEMQISSRFGEGTRVLLIFPQV